MITPENLQSLFLARQSTRAYDASRMIEPAKIERCIEAARISPSACNAQPWKFIVVDHPEIKNQLADYTSNKLLSMNHFTKQAPVHIAIVQEKANFTSSVGQILKDKEYPLIDIGIAALQLCLQATTEGLGSCILGWFDEKKAKKLLGIPRSKRLVLIITLGYPADGYEIRPKNRKPTSEILSYNAY